MRDYVERANRIIAWSVASNRNAAITIGCIVAVDFGALLLRNMLILTVFSMMVLVG